jgi:hypothetical protein
MTADTDAVERMLREGASSGKSSPDNSLLAGLGNIGEGGAGTTAGDEGSWGGVPKPAPGSDEERRFLEIAWQDPKFRESFYELNREKLESMGIPCDGTFPMQPGHDGQRVMQGGKAGLTIVPEAGFVVKTRTMETNEKVFVNFCKSPKVKSFSNEPDPNDPDVQRVRIPLSLGPARNDLDKTGEACVVYDVVFNTEVVDQATHSEEFKSFLIGLGLGWVMEKSGGGLDTKNFNLVKLRGNYKGKFPVMQTVRAEALIEEVNPVDEGGGSYAAPHHAWEHAAFSSHGPGAIPATRAAAENSNYADSSTGLRKAGAVPSYKGVSAEPKGVETPEKRLYIDCADGRQFAWADGRDFGSEVKALLVKIEVPRMEKAGEADVDIANGVLSFEVEGKYELEVELPLEVDDNASEAIFDRPRQQLTLVLPLKSWTEKAYAVARAKAEAQGAQAVAASAEEAQKQWGAGEGDKTGAGRDRPGVSLGKGAATEGEAASGAAAAANGAGAGAAPKAGEGKQRSEFEARLRTKLLLQSAKAAEEAPPRPIRGSNQEQELIKKQKEGANVSDRRPFECERCQWAARATAIRRCRRCQWCEPGSKEEAEMIEQVKEQQKWRASKKLDEVGSVDETGGVEDESSVRAFRFACRLAWELDDDSPSWLEGIREQHYGPEA